MKKKTLIISEITGFFVVATGVLLLWNIYELTDRSTLGVVFGAVNSSVWERAKCISICFMLCGLCELLCVRVYFRTFVVSKTLGLCVSLLSFIIPESILGADTYAEFLVLSVSVLCGFGCSYLLTVLSVNLRQLFAPACFLLMLIFMMTFSFTAFAPKLWLFRDPYTGCYGVVPRSFDMGAVYLG
ncbi:MAG: DUF6512 family protein [Ruminococcus sp.]|nr:DUF6512 family protein [Ruminococcus sp.]